ncbi:hypothetical protein ACKFKF_30140 [Phormidesmis sp. 146-12]
MSRLQKGMMLVAIGIGFAIVLQLPYQLIEPFNPGSAAVQMTRATPTNRLLETMGVAVKVHYASDKDYAVIKSKLGGLGIRYLRDGGSGESYYRRVRELSQIGGFKWTMVMDPRDGFTGENVPEKGIVPILPHVIAVEGPNEWDVQSNLKYKDQSFPIATRTFQSEMYRAIKNYRHPNAAIQSQVRAIRVLTPSLAFHQNAGRQGVVDADMGNLHSYPGGTSALPDRGLDNNVRSMRRLLRLPRSPLVATETGYCNDLNRQGCTNQGGVTERSSAKYATRMYLEYFLRGIYRTHLYNFSLDEWSLFLRRDGSVKPAYSAVRDFIQVLKDSGGAFSPKSLRYSLSGNTQDVKSVLLQKRNGAFYLVLWLNVLSVKSDFKDVETARSLTLSLGDRISQANLYLPTFNGTTPQKTYRNPRSISLSVPDHPLIVELR